MTSSLLSDLDPLPVCYWTRNEKICHTGYCFQWLAAGAAWSWGRGGREQMSVLILEVLLRIQLYFGLGSDRGLSARKIRPVFGGR